MITQKMLRKIDFSSENLVAKENCAHREPQSLKILILNSAHQTKNLHFSRGAKLFLLQTISTSIYPVLELIHA